MFKIKRSSSALVKAAVNSYKTIDKKNIIAKFPLSFITFYSAILYEQIINTKVEKGFLIINEAKEVCFGKITYEPLVFLRQYEKYFPNKNRMIHVKTCITEDFQNTEVVKDIFRMLIDAGNILVFTEHDLFISKTIIDLTNNSPFKLLRYARTNRGLVHNVSKNLITKFVCAKDILADEYIDF